jgi:hypothetical protein
MLVFVGSFIIRSNLDFSSDGDNKCIQNCNGNLTGTDHLWSRRMISVKGYKTFFYVVRTVHFGMKLYNDQRNAQGF